MKVALIFLFCLLVENALGFLSHDAMLPVELTDELAEGDQFKGSEEVKRESSPGTEVVKKRALNCRNIFSKTSTINGLPCPRAIDTFGSYLCYRYDGFAQDCCYKCNSIRSNRAGCIYGDKLYSCKTLRPSHCYLPFNARQCCSTCPRYRTGPAGCEYGDKNVAQCSFSIPKNPGNCYNLQNRGVCCATCRKYRRNIQGCEYGDHPATWRTQHGVFPNCRSLINYYGASKCKQNHVKVTCCASCYGRKRSLQDETNSANSGGLAIMEPDQPDQISADVPEQASANDDKTDAQMLEN